MACLTYRSINDAVHIRLGKKDNIDILEKVLKQHSIKIDYSEETYALAYIDGGMTDTEFQRILKNYKELYNG